jgi:signal transduction histidine kinase
MDKMQLYAEAHPLLLKILEQAKAEGHGNHLTNIMLALSQNSKNLGRLEDALMYLEHYSDLRDSLVSVENLNHLNEKEVAELTASLETQEKERNRIARDLHDGVGSLMSGISAQIEVLRAQPGVQNGSASLSQLRDLVKEATSELRRTSYELMPASLLRQGLEPAIRDLCVNLLVKNGIEPSLEINSDLSTLNTEQQLTVYRIVQELLNNIVKHAAAQHVLIQFNQYDDEISLVVEDDGKGFDVLEKKRTGGLGLGSLQSRVNLLKGFLDISSVPEQGTTVTVNFKLSDQR